MGLFDRFTPKKPTLAPAPALPAAAVPTAPGDKPTVAGGVMPRLAQARACLVARDLPGARAIYDEVLAAAGDRADVLMTLSADLGSTGHVVELIELVAPRYDTQRHGPAAGLNLLQAYLAVRNAEAAQHLLDLLFGLQRPELEDRLIGFSRVIADIQAIEESTPYPPAAEAARISLISLSKPVWFYGLEAQASALLPAPEGRLRRVAFAHCALPGLDQPAETAARPEDALGRFSRGLPLWLAETFCYSAAYESLAAVGTAGEHYALFPAEWVTENIRQLNDSRDGGLDYVVTGAVRSRNDDHELTLRVWEVKKYRELKAFTVRWTPATADAELGRFHGQVRAYMEWTARPAGAGLPYAAPAAPASYIAALGASLTLFLGEKNLLAPEQMPAGAAVFLAAARANPDDVRAQLLLVTALSRLRARGGAAEEEALAHARAWLASPAAAASGVGSVIL